MENDDQVRGPWSQAEDDQLRNLVNQNGPKNWPKISRSIPGRSGLSCRMRWNNQLSPNVKNRPFTQAEDITIVAARNKIGNKWVTIARMLDKRSDHAVMNRWNSTLKRKYGDGTLTVTEEEQDRINKILSVNGETLPGETLNLELSLFPPSPKETTKSCSHDSLLSPGVEEKLSPGGFQDTSLNLSLSLSSHSLCNLYMPS